KESEYRWEGTSQAAPGKVLSRQVPPTSPARSKRTRLFSPARLSRAAIPMPENPVPMMATRRCGVVSCSVTVNVRSVRGVQGGAARGGKGEPGPRDSGAFEPAGPAVRAGRGAARRGQRAIAAGAPGRPSRPARRQTYLAGPASRPALSKVATTLRAAQVLVSMWWWLRRAALAASRGSRPTDL